MTIRIFTLGQFALVRNERLVSRLEWGTHRAATLCKVLATYRGQKLHKEQLQDWIWPDATPIAAARNLRVALSELRRCLEPDLTPRAASRYLETGGSVGLYCDEVWIDSQALSEAVELDPNAPASLSSLQEAVALYQGTYLPDDLYADWAQTERQHQTLVYETVLLHLAEAYAAHAREDDAIRTYRQALVDYPTSETLVEHLMRYASSIGQPAEALKAYNIFDQTLKKEFGFAPSAHLTDRAEAMWTNLAETATSPSWTSHQYEDEISTVIRSASERQRLAQALARAAELANELVVALERVRHLRATINASAE